MQAQGKKEGTLTSQKTQHRIIYTEKSKTARKKQPKKNSFFSVPVYFARLTGRSCIQGRLPSIVTERDGTVDSRVEEGIETGDSTRVSQASKRGERRSRTDGHGSTGELMQQAGCGVNRMVQSTDHSQWISLRSLQDFGGRKRGGENKRRR